MKKLSLFKNLLVLSILFNLVTSCSSCKVFNKHAPLNEQIVGTWQLCNSKDSTAITNFGKDGQQRYKYITPESFMVVDFIDKSNQMYGAFMGTYSIQSNIYTENILNTGSGYQRLLNEKNSFSLTIDGEYMSIKGINNGYGPELWKRIE